MTPLTVLRDNATIQKKGSRMEWNGIRSNTGIDHALLLLHRTPKTHQQHPLHLRVFQTRSLRRQSAQNAKLLMTVARGHQSLPRKPDPAKRRPRGQRHRAFEHSPKRRCVIEPHFQIVRPCDSPKTHQKETIDRKRVFENERQSLRIAHHRHHAIARRQHALLQSAHAPRSQKPAGRIHEHHGIRAGHQIR